MSWETYEKYGPPLEICGCGKGCYVAGKKPCCACGRVSTQCPARDRSYSSDSVAFCQLRIGHEGAHRSSGRAHRSSGRWGNE